MLMLVRTVRVGCHDPPLGRSGNRSLDRSPSRSRRARPTHRGTARSTAVRGKFFRDARIRDRRASRNLDELALAPWNRDSERSTRSISRTTCRCARAALSDHGRVRRSLWHLRMAGAAARNRRRRPGAAQVDCEVLWESIGSSQVETIQVHHLGPGRDEVLNELLLRVRASVDLGQRAELRVRTED